jgi:hypothetical protein
MGLGGVSLTYYSGTGFSQDAEFLPFVTHNTGDAPPGADQVDVAHKRSRIV